MSAIVLAAVGAFPPPRVCLIPACRGRRRHEAPEHVPTGSRVLLGPFGELRAPRSPGELQAPSPVPWCPISQHRCWPSWLQALSPLPGALLPAAGLCCGRLVPGGLLRTQRGRAGGAQKPAPLLKVAAQDCFWSLGGPAAPTCSRDPTGRGGSACPGPPLLQPLCPRGTAVSAGASRCSLPLPACRAGIVPRLPPFHSDAVTPALN